MNIPIICFIPYPLFFLRDSSAQTTSCRVYFLISSGYAHAHLLEAGWRGYSSIKTSHLFLLTRNRANTVQALSELFFYYFPPVLL